MTAGDGVMHRNEGLSTVLELLKVSGRFGFEAPLDARTCEERARSAPGPPMHRHIPV